MEVVKGVNALTDIIVLNNLLDCNIDDYAEWGIGEIPAQPILLNNKSDPLATENLDKALELVNKIRLLLPQKSIWLYTGYCVKEIYKNQYIILDQSAANIAKLEPDYIVVEASQKDSIRNNILIQCDVIVDGRYIDSQRDIMLFWRGSTNQRVIDVQKSLQKGEIVLWTN